jgi:hypothetical protein
VTFQHLAYPIHITFLLYVFGFIEAELENPPVKELLSPPLSNKKAKPPSNRQPGFL